MINNMGVIPISFERTCLALSVDNCHDLSISAYFCSNLQCSKIIFVFNLFSRGGRWKWIEKMNEVGHLDVTELTSDSLAW